MASSLAAQLQNIASVDAERLTSRYGQPSSKSYLFPPKVASTHDLDAVHALGQSGFDELLQLDPTLEEYEEPLFSEAAKRTDRMMLNEEENDKLDHTIKACIRKLGKWIGIMAGGKCIEWLVRRFRVHEMESEALLEAFLPYHESPNFARILAILSLPTTSPYHAPFAALIKKAQPVPRSYIAAAFSSARDPSLRLLTGLAGALKEAVTNGASHRALITFWSATLVDILERTQNGRVPESVVKILVEAFVELLSLNNAGPEVSAAVYPPLVLLTRQVRLADAPFAAVVEALLTAGTGANPSQRVLTLLVILDGRKGWGGGLGDDAPANLAKIPQLGNLLIAAADKYGFENALKVVVAALIEDVIVSKQTLTTLVDYTALPNSVVQVAATKLLETPSKVHDVARVLLSTLRQRHPQAIDTAVVSASADADIDPTLVSWSSAETAFVDVHSADVASRVSGVREMYAVAEAVNLDTENAAILLASDEKLRSAQTALLARLRDTDEAVLNAIYLQPAILLALLTGTDYIEAITSTFVAPKPEPAALGAHLVFLGQHYVPAHQTAQRAVFERLLLPNLLAVQERRAIGPAQWPAAVRACRLLERVKSVPALDAAKEDLITFNKNLVEALALAIAASGDIGARVDALVAALQAPLVESRLLAALILAQLVSCAGGYQHQVAARSLSALETILAGTPLREIDSVELALSEDLLKAVVTKTKGIKTSHRAFLALLAAAATVPRATTVSTWLADAQEVEAPRALAHALYRWANSANLSPALARHLLHAVLGQLGEDALLFLAAVWTDARDSGLRVAALRHAAAFVSAYAKADKKHTDFQLAIPALLVALQDPERNVRAAAGVLLKAIAATPKSSSADIYALENIYGPRSELVQLLKPSDLNKYLEMLTTSLDDLVVDAGRLALVHGSELDVQSKGGRKDGAFRRDVVDWLYSHVLGWRSIGARKSLLSSLARAVNVSRLQGSLPLLTALAQENNEDGAWLAALPAADRDEYLELIFSAFNARHAAALIEADSEAWPFVLDLASKAPATNAPQLRGLALVRMADGLFPALKPEQKAEYVIALIRSLRHLSTEDSLDTRAVLAQFKLTPAEIVTVLDTLLAPLEAPNVRKKAKTDDDEDRVASAVTELTVFVESRTWSALPGDAPLVASLMGVLSAVLAKRQSITEGVDYLEQEVLGGILALLERITNPDQLLRARVGIEVVVKIVRASTNPRTCQRALLVAAELARLIPESVLHNVMPIFTFMGSSDLQRDDAFSFGVVQKTVANIVPVMTASLKDKATTKLELYVEARAFLAIFTDMASRLPKHRTLPFFVHLVQSLGADDFLAPVCMLLAAGKGKSAGLELPVSLANAFPAAVRTEALLEVVRESARLVEAAAAEDIDSSPTPDNEPFLASDDGREHKQAVILLQLSSTLAKGLAGKVCPQPAVEAMVRELLALSASPASLTMDEDDLSIHLDNALTGAMGLLSVPSFLSTTAEILKASGDDVSRALMLFSSRLPLVKPDLRGRSKDAMAAIIIASAALLPAAPALAALNAVVSTALPAEDAALSGIVPASVAAAKGGDLGALTLLSALIRRLGPRAIPYIQSILDCCLSLLREPPTAKAADGAFATLAALVDTVPTFVGGKQLVALLRAAAEFRDADQTASQSLIAAVAKRIPTKTVVPAVMDLWTELKGASAAPTAAFFGLLKHTLRHADRKALPSLTRRLFAFFLDVLDLRARNLETATLDDEELAVVESSAINSFLELVTKLSDAAFKPLFGRLYDWAVIDASGAKPNTQGAARKSVLLRVMDGLLERFRSLLTPYMATLLPLIDELLESYAANKGEGADEDLWALMLSVITKSCDVDDGAFWSDAALGKLLPQLIAQLAVYPSVSASADSPPAKALAALIVAINGEGALKKANTAILMATRAEEPKERMAALRALDAAWERHSDELISYVPETVAEFLAELIEDENAEVEALARKVLSRIEGVTGSLKECLE